MPFASGAIDEVAALKAYTWLHCSKALDRSPAHRRASPEYHSRRALGEVEFQGARRSSAHRNDKTIVKMPTTLNQLTESSFEA
jgi:hypothetical protein